MASLEQSFEEACISGKIPHAVIAASNKDGSFAYIRSFGLKALDQDPAQPIKDDDIMSIASLTKLMTTIAALQCVERGLIGLSDDVADVLPELAALEVLKGIDQDKKPILKKRQNAITLRHLLTHSAGLVYDILSPLNQIYNEATGRTAFQKGSTVISRFSAPLLFEPGTGWHYSPSLDWVGLLITRLTRTSLEEYMKCNIWGPLGIEDATFFLEQNDLLKDRLVGMTLRDPTAPEYQGKVVPYSGPPVLGEATEELGGHGAFTSIPSYLKVLTSILRNDEKLLRKETVALMFKPQLSQESQMALQKVFSSSETARLYIADLPDTVRYDWGFGGALSLDNVEWGRRQGTMVWSGLPNLFWFIDPEAGLCGVYGGQVMMNGDPQTKKMISLFERTMYQRSSEIA
ncbi:hypothetical protein LOY89_004147 [Ophidiomyces ophidiicola]|nr:hypothetical protein LOZ60_002837 [Ophidiomyces ophidiicola]KAI2030569.1 hypothetical protein LOZ48_003154 [Ophidiomyces ophidiicola]KAI2097356.1 hypothetical protein LOZ33_003325 [Ophidiomyces ophidiicola]KAI2121817.1 hypothetical protein LOZ31_005056 [Ophidiomyces ophidiicola]KAI2267056.1 hypothetical protein LOZ05_003930 [Ophidiomyces ophidiicola]